MKLTKEEKVQCISTRKTFRLFVVSKMVLWYPLHLPVMALGEICTVTNRI